MEEQVLEIGNGEREARDGKRETNPCIWDLILYFEIFQALI